jgi:ParB family transcriptional regulator, chromosome partitioning protein
MNITVEQPPRSKKWRVTCECGFTGTHTTEEFARSRADKHVAEAHAESTSPTEVSAPQATGEYSLVPVGEIVPSPDNPRRDLGDLSGLVASIEAVGIVEPLIVERCDDDEPHRFHLLAGERRWAAAQKAGVAEVPCIVRNAVIDRGRRIELMIIENLQREDLAPIDEARALKQLVDLGLTQRVIAERVGCSQSHVSKRLELLVLPEKVQAKVGHGITVSDALELTKIADHPKAIEAAITDGKRYGDVAQAVERIQKDIEADAKHKELTAAAKAKGWTVVKEQPYGQRTYKHVEKPDRWGPGSGAIQLEVGKHRKEPCHGVVIRKSWSGIEQVDVCTDPSRHSAKGESKLKVKAPPKVVSPHEAKERAEQKAKKAAAERRMAALVTLFAVDGPNAAKGPTPPAMELIARALVEEAGADERKLAYRILGIEAPDVWGHELRRLADTGPRNTLRVALACSLARGEVRARGTWITWSDRSVQDLYGFLQGTGYELDDFERQKLEEAKAEAAQEAAEDAAARAEEELEQLAKEAECASTDSDRPTSTDAAATSAERLSGRTSEVSEAVPA